MVWYSLTMTGPAPHEHLVHLYEGAEHSLTLRTGDYLAAGLQAGEAVLVIATGEHLAAFTARIAESGADLDAARRERRFLALDAAATLAAIAPGGEPDRVCFERTVGAVLAQFDARAAGRGVRAYGEMVGILWASSRFTAALQLEALWNELLGDGGITLLCGYPIDVFGEEFCSADVGPLLSSHTQLLSAGGAALDGALERAMAEVLGTRLPGIRHAIAAETDSAPAGLPSSEALILWLRSNLADHAGEILNRARGYYRACA